MQTVKRSVDAIPFGRLAIVLQAAAAIAFLLYILDGDGVRFPLSAQPERVEIAFEDAAGLTASNHNRVTIAGVEVGEIKKIRYANGGAIAEAHIDADARDRLRSDARAVIVPRSALNDLSVDLLPGESAQRLPAGARVAPDRAASPVNLDRILETLDSDTRAQIQVLFGNAATGLRGRSTPLRDAVARLGDTSESTARVSAALADRRRLLTRLVGELDTVFATIASRGDNLADLISTGRTTLEATADREALLARRCASCRRRCPRRRPRWPRCAGSRTRWFRR